ncbi:MAG: sulfatase-like hydrolase/transferase [Vicinamibacterales bacterium]
MKRVVVTVAAMFLTGTALVLLVRQRPPVAGGKSIAARPNVLLITLDTVRADRVSPALTPNLERLAARGTRFTNLRATAPLTLPSHTSLMTGTIPPVHGVHENGVIFNRKLPTLARSFRDNGYATAAFVGAYVLNRRFGLDEGFELYDDAVRRDVRRVEQLEAERPGSEVVDAALKWMNDAGVSKRRFVWVHLYDAHAPYLPPKEFLAKAGGRAYDGEIAYVDAQVGRLLDALEAQQMTADTIVAIVGDHGEALGEHGEATHGMLIYDATLRVPLILAGPGFDRGSSVDRDLSMSHVAPALLRAAGLGASAGPDCGAGPIHAAPAAAGPSRECDVFSESRYPRRAGWHAVSALSDSQWKLIRSSEQELFDLRADPSESNNVATAHPNIVQAMAARLQTLQASGGAESAALAPEAAERLRALGYVSGANAITADDPGAPNPAPTIARWSEFEMALADLQANRQASALSRLGALARANPGGPVFQSTYAQALKDAGRVKEAVVLYQAAAAKWPSDPTLFHDLAVAAREAGNPAEAQRAEQAALALDSSSAMAQNGLGLLHTDAGRPTDAAAAFQKAVDQDPTNASYWTNLGNARGAVKDSAGAEAAYRKALAIDRAFADALNGLGTLMVRVGRAAEAVALFTRALESDPQFHEARLNLGIAYQQSGQGEKAAAVYREILQKTPPRFARERAAAGELLKAIK